VGSGFIEELLSRRSRLSAKAVRAIPDFRRSRLNKWVRLAILIAALHITAPGLFACECSEVKVKTTKKALQNWFNSFDGALFTGTVESVVQGSVVAIYTTVGCCGCLPHYATGKRYFVTAFNKGNQLETRMCTVEEPSAAKSYERAVGKGNAPRPVQTP
jgi:hypothetical protein